MEKGGRHYQARAAQLNERLAAQPDLARAWHQRAAVLADCAATRVDAFERFRAGLNLPSAPRTA